MNELFWYLKVSTPAEHLSAAAVTFFMGFLLYQCDYVLIFGRYLLMIVKHGSSEPTRKPEPLPPALVVLPTLLRDEDELTGLLGALESAATNDYTGTIYIVAAIDDGAHSGDLFTRLEAWTRSFPAPPNVHLLTTKTSQRVGKALAIEAGIDLMHEMVARKEVAAFPTLFYNMDADGRLGPHALAHMADKILSRSRITGQRPMIVASNVCIAPNTFWGGAREFFTVRGQLSLLVAAEFLTAISIGKMNGRLIPVTNASGALYCTWSELHVEAPRWASFMQSLRPSSWFLWWLGVAPPSFASHKGRNPEAQTGPGDDTWMTWLALSARWTNDRIVLDLPRTPGHAFVYALRSYVSRPLAYALRARIETKTPTTIRALWKQRVRWNSSRIQDVQRWRSALLYHWSAGVPVILSTALLLYVHGAVVVSLLIWPLVSSHGSFATLVVAWAINMTIRTLSTGFALVVDGARPKSAFKFLALPLWVPYNFVFNTLTTVWGCLADIFGYGVNTRFSPEETHVRSRLSRIAIAYRVRRALALAVRAVIHNDVPLGAFWFGWHETAWTPNGFEGWSTGKTRALLPRKTAAPAPIPEAAFVVPAVNATGEQAVLDVLRDSVHVQHVAPANVVDEWHESIGEIAIVEIVPAANETSSEAEALTAATGTSGSGSRPSIPPPKRPRRSAA
jgi:cellulose synthase/poly-beta-1,6-N-acetylglucosamine synthase-like glycosyltransferase